MAFIHYNRAVAIHSLLNPHREQATRTCVIKFIKVLIKMAKSYFVR